MPTYVYESIPSHGADPERFEITQRMNDAPLTHHPETGEPVRRIVTGGVGVMGKPVRRSTQVDKSLAAATPCGCAKGALAAMSVGARSPGIRSPQACAHGGARRVRSHNHRH
jgi:hypothetical protein